MILVADLQTNNELKKTIREIINFSEAIPPLSCQTLCSLNESLFLSDMQHSLVTTRKPLLLYGQN